MSKGSSLSKQGQVELMEGIVHKGQSDFINYSLTQATITGLTFVATGGIEGALSLGQAGLQLSKQAASSYGQLSLKTWSQGNAIFNAGKRDLIDFGSKQFMEHSSYGAKRYIVKRGIHNKVANFRNYNHNVMSPQTVKQLNDFKLFFSHAKGLFFP